jgi:hypothetical protein
MWGTGVLAEEENEPRVVSVELRSPLVMLIHLPPVALTSMAVGLVYLAERICTFGPTVENPADEQSPGG